MTQQSGEELFNTVKSEFPLPVSMDALESAFPGTYSVGGALAIKMGFGVERRFPTDEELVEALQKANSKLDSDKAKSYAKDIINRNDEGAMARAWDALKEALTAS